MRFARLKTLLAAVLTEQRKQFIRNKWNGKIDPHYLAWIENSLQDHGEYVDWAVGQLAQRFLTDPVELENAVQKQLKEDIEFQTQRNSEQFGERGSDPVWIKEHTQRIRDRFIGYRENELARSLIQIKKRIEWFDRYKETKDPRVTQQIKDTIKAPTDIHKWGGEQLDQLMKRYPELKKPSELIQRHPEVAKVVLTQETPKGNWEVVKISANDAKRQAQMETREIQTQLLLRIAAHETQNDGQDPDVSNVLTWMRGSTGWSDGSELVALEYPIQLEPGRTEKAKEVIGNLVKPMVESGLCAVKQSFVKKDHLRYYLMSPVWADYLKAMCMYGNGTKWCTTDYAAASTYLSSNDMYLFIMDGVTEAQMSVEYSSGRMIEFQHPDRTDVQESDDVWQIAEQLNGVDLTRFRHYDMVNDIERQFDIDRIMSQYQNYANEGAEPEYLYRWLSGADVDDVEQISRATTINDIPHSYNDWFEKYLKENPETLYLKVFGDPVEIDLDSSDLREQRITDDALKVLDELFEEVLDQQYPRPSDEQIKAEKEKLYSDYLDTMMDSESNILENIKDEANAQLAEFNRISHYGEEETTRMKEEWDQLMESGHDTDHYMDYAGYLENDNDYGHYFRGLKRIVKKHVGE